LPSPLLGVVDEICTEQPVGAGCPANEFCASNVCVLDVCQEREFTFYL
jgi:hypothetical protein